MESKCPFFKQETYQYQYNRWTTLARLQINKYFFSEKRNFGIWIIESFQRVEMIKFFLPTRKICFEKLESVMNRDLHSVVYRYLYDVTILVHAQCTVYTGWLYVPRDTNLPIRSMATQCGNTGPSTYRHNLVSSYQWFQRSYSTVQINPNTKYITAVFLHCEWIHGIQTIIMVQ